MKNLTVRASLLGVLLLFAAMLVVGAALGVYALGQSTRSMSTMYQVTSQVITINDAYKDTTRVRAALTRAYTGIKDGGAAAERDGALASAGKSQQRALEFIGKYDSAPAYEGQDAALKRELIAADRKSVV